MRIRKFISRISTRGYAPGLGALVALAFILLFESLIQAQDNALAAQNRLEMLSHAALLRSSIERELNAQLFLANGLASYLDTYHDTLDPQHTHTMLANLYRRASHVINLAVAVGYRIRYVYPIAGNQATIDVDYRQQPDQWPLVKSTIERGNGTLVGPIPLIQGGHGLVYRYPIYVDGRYWGLISIVIDPQSLFATAFKSARSSRFQFAIRNQAAPGKSAFYGDAALFARPDALLLESKIPGGRWEWAIVRSAGKASSGVVFWTLRALGLAISLVLGFMLYTLLRERGRLKMHALYDSLTGLANRRLLHDRISQAMIQAKRFNHRMAILYIDLDYFKEVNDTHGHATGDAFLVAVAEKLTTCIRQSDTLSRVGGDEFIIVLGGISSPQDATLVAQNIQRMFESPLPIGDIALHVSLSIGIAIYQPTDDDSIEDLLHKADLALYQVKAQGRDGYMLFGA